MEAPCLAWTVQAAGGGDILVWGIFFIWLLSGLEQTENCWNASLYLNIVAGNVHLFMPRVCPWSCLKQDNTPCHKAHIVSNWFLEHDELSVLACTVIRSQSTRSPLRWDVMGDSHHGCSFTTSVAPVWCHHLNMDQKHWGIFPGPPWIHATKN